MNEIQKTGIFAALAAVVGIAAWATKPTITTQSINDIAVKAGKELFADKFTDPLTAASLKIIKYDETLGSLKEFAVERNKKEGGWIIPSKENYTADAANQMSNAANALIGVKVFAVASTKRDDHAYFGVVEPNPETLKVGDQGVGLLIKMQDAKGESLASLVVGKVDGKDPKRRFVRVPNTDLIYNVEIDTAPFTTDFSKWIEDDLLKLSSTDLQTIGVRDYTIVPSNGAFSMGKVYDADLSFATSNGAWNVNSIKVYEGRNSTPRILAENEQLNSTKVNEIKNTLDSLKIVDVIRKPKGLAGDLRAEKVLLDDNESQMSLVNRGFIPIPTADGSATDILSANGELLATLNNGVQYVLRFGNTARDSEEKEGEDASASAGVNRYMLVSTRLDDAFYPVPIMQQLPETVEEMKAMEEASKAAQLPGALEGMKLPGSFSYPPELTPIPTPGQNAPIQPAPTQDTPTQSTPGQPSAGAPELGAPPAPERTNSGPADERSMLRTNDSTRYVAFQATPEQPAPGPVTAGATAAEKDQETPQELKERLEATREQITKENLRKTDEREDKIKTARKKVDELNARFAEWYYVISEADYKKMKVGLADLIQPKTATPAAPAAPGFGGQGLPPNFNFGNE